MTKKDPPVEDDEVFNDNLANYFLLESERYRIAYEMGARAAREILTKKINMPDSWSKTTFSQGTYFNEENHYKEEGARMLAHKLIQDWTSDLDAETPMSAPEKYMTRKFINSIKELIGES